MYLSYSRKNITTYIENSIYLLNLVKKVPSREWKILSNIYPKVKPIFVGKWTTKSLRIKKFLGHLKDFTAVIDSAIAFLQTDDDLFLKKHELSWKRIEKHIDLLKEEFEKTISKTHKNFPPEVEKKIQIWADNLDPFEGSRNINSVFEAILRKYQSSK